MLILYYPYGTYSFFFVFIATEKIPTAAERLGRDFFLLG